MFSDQDHAQDLQSVQNCGDVPGYSNDLEDFGGLTHDVRVNAKALSGEAR